LQTSDIAAFAFRLNYFQRATASSPLQSVQNPVQLLRTIRMGRSSSITGKPWSDHTSARLV